jgi:hypothetical protein
MIHLRLERIASRRGMTVTYRLRLWQWDPGCTGRGSELFQMSLACVGVRRSCRHDI